MTSYYLIQAFLIFTQNQPKEIRISMEKGRSANDFEIIARLGEGAFGQVFKVKRKEDGQIYAMKKIKTVTMKQKDRTNALNEIRILASMVGDHIIGYKDSFYDENSANLCIVLQFAGQGDIMKKINDYTKKKKFIEEPQIWKALVHIAKGIRSLHDSNVLHRDLKSANIFITADGTYKLGDLNISKVLKQGLARTQTGTPYYCSPEVWQDKPYGQKSDIWSFGCVLYEMCAQKPPFTASDIQGLYRKICAGQFSRIPNVYSNQLSDVISSMLKLNPSLRPSIYDLLKNPVVIKNYGGQIGPSEVPKNANLLQTIQFNNRGWKNLNSNLPKSQYEQSDQDQEKNWDNKGNELGVPVIRQSRPVSSASDKKCMQNNSSEYRNNSNEKRNGSVQRDDNVPYRRERVLSAHGKNPNPNLNTPEKPKDNKNNLVLPPIDPKNKQRRGSDNLDPRLMPPRPDNRRDNSKSSRNSSHQKDNLRRAGQRVLNNGQLNYKVPY